MKLAAVILAGGEGRRIGGNKPLLVLGGWSLIDRALDKARGWADNVAVSVRDAGQLGHLGVPTIPDAPEVAGPLGGLSSALEFARCRNCETVLTLPADMPFLPHDLASRLTGAIGSARAAIAESGGHLHPVCGLWRVEALELLPDYLASRSRSLQGFAETIGMTITVWPSKPFDPFFNINSKDDLAEAELILARNRES